MNTVTMILTYKNEAGTTTVYSKQMTGDLSTNIESDVMAGSATDAEFAVNIPFAKIQAIAIGCSKVPGTTTTPNPGSVALTVKTNSITDPGFTITPSNGYGWAVGDLNPLKFTSDITKFFITSQQPTLPDVAASFFFTVRCLLDSSV